MNEELKRIVENMIQAGESESNIALVIQNFKPSKKKKKLLQKILRWYQSLLERV